MGASNSHGASVKLTEVVAFKGSKLRLSRWRKSPSSLIRSREEESVKEKNSPLSSSLAVPFVVKHAAFVRCDEGDGGERVCKRVCMCA